MSENGRFDLKNELVLFEKEGRLATITINRPKKLNALSLDLDTPTGLDDAAMVQSLLLDSEEYLQAMRTFDQKRNK